MLTKRAPIGQIALLADEACSNQGCFLLIPRRETDTRFYYYWLSVQTDYLQVLGRGSTFMELSTDELKSLNIPHPSSQIQRAIADYLDRETTRLDALVAAKERVLGLLAEKRLALITRAVTRGLDPRARLRDSGIPWLGEIPAHWETSKFTWSIFIIEGQVDPEIEPYVNMPLIAPNHIESETGRLLCTETAADQGAISGKYLCQCGDVIYSKIRPALRKATIAVEQCLCSADMYPLRSRKDVQPEFLLFFLLSEPIQYLGRSGVEPGGDAQDQSRGPWRHSYSTSSPRRATLNSPAHRRAGRKGLTTSAHRLNTPLLCSESAVGH